MNYTSTCGPIVNAPGQIRTKVMNDLKLSCFSVIANSSRKTVVGLIMRSKCKCTQRGQNSGWPWQFQFVPQSPFLTAVNLELTASEICFNLPKMVLLCL